MRVSRSRPAAARSHAGQPRSEKGPLGALRHTPERAPVGLRRILVPGEPPQPLRPRRILGVGAIEWLHLAEEHGCGARALRPGVSADAIEADYRRRREREQAIVERSGSSRFRRIRARSPADRDCRLPRVRARESVEDGGAEHAVRLAAERAVPAPASNSSSRSSVPVSSTRPPPRRRSRAQRRAVVTSPPSGFAGPPSRAPSGSGGCGTGERAPESRKAGATKRKARPRLSGARPP